jgi:ABC-type glycerol-3-phosphate transport system substrate-binding protein
MPRTQTLSRRTTLKLGGAAMALPIVHIRTTAAAGKLAVGFEDHPVPGAGAVMRKLVEDWAAKTKTDVQLQFFDQEAQAGAGHDILTFVNYEVDTNANKLEPMDDVIQRLAGKYGRLDKMSEYMTNIEGSYRAVPTYWLNLSHACCTRIDLFRQYVGMDVQTIFPASGQMGPGYERWTWDAFLAAAEKCAKAGHPFGLPISNCADANNWVGAMFQSFGAELVDARGNITIRSEKVRQAIDYGQRIAAFLTPDVYGWDNASNNKALITGRSALIVNPPSAWAVALRDNPAVGEQIWHHPMPAGPAGRFINGNLNAWGVWSFSKNKTAAKELLEWLSEREQAERLITAGQGYDVPVFESMTDFKVWEEVGPPKGTLSNYPVKPEHRAELVTSAWPAPRNVAAHIQSTYLLPKSIARITQSRKTVDDTIAWAEGEIEGFRR